MYLNFDMIASPNYGLFRYDGDGSDFGLVGPDGSDEIEALFERYYTERSIPSEASRVQRTLRLPGVHPQRCPGRRPVHRCGGHQDRGAGRQVGRHRGRRLRPVLPPACDTIANVNRDALRINADAIAYVTFLYATGGEVIND